MENKLRKKEEMSKNNKSGKKVISWYPHNIVERVGSAEASGMMIRIFHIIPFFLLFGREQRDDSRKRFPKFSADTYTLCVGCSAIFFTAALLLLSFPINCRLITAAERLTFYCAVKRVDNKNAISSYSALFSSFNTFLTELRNDLDSGFMWTLTLSLTFIIESYFRVHWRSAVLSLAIKRNM